MMKSCDAFRGERDERENPVADLLSKTACIRRVQSTAGITVCLYLEDRGVNTAFGPCLPPVRAAHPRMADLLCFARQPRSSLRGLRFAHRLRTCQGCTLQGSDPKRGRNGLPDLSRSPVLCSPPGPIGSPTSRRPPSRRHMRSWFSGCHHKKMLSFDRLIVLNTSKTDWKVNFLLIHVPRL